MVADLLLVDVPDQIKAPLGPFAPIGLLQEVSWYLDTTMERLVALDIPDLHVIRV